MLLNRTTSFCLSFPAQALLNIERGPDGHISDRTVERVRTALGEIRGAASFRGSPTGWSASTGIGGQRVGGNDTSVVSSAPASATASLDTLVISADVRGSVAMGGVQVWRDERDTASSSSKLFELLETKR